LTKESHMEFIKRVFKLDPDLLPPDDFVVRKHLIVDIETSGLDKNEDIVICGGLLDYEKKFAYVYFLPDPQDWKKFRRFLRNTIQWYIGRGYTAWAYNADFERSFLMIKEIRDLMMYRVVMRIEYDYEYEEEYELPDYRFSKMTITATDIIRTYYPKFYLGDNNNGEVKKLESFLKSLFKDYVASEKIPDIYFKKWLLKRDKSAIDTIVHHNFADLYLEAWILWYISQVVRTIIKSLEDYALKKFGYLPTEIIEYLRDYV